MRLLIFALITLALSACEKSPEELQKELDQVKFEQQQEKIRQANAGVVNVQKLSTFHDDIAYGQERSTYLITDTRTGKQFIGVSGIGIAETGSHYCGKNCTTQDER